MRVAWVALVVLFMGLPASAQDPPAPQGDVQKGKEAWGVALRCQNCHGAEAQGNFGPDLAGRGLSFAQFRRAVREPWGVMLAYTITLAGSPAAPGAEIFKGSRVDYMKPTMRGGARNLELVDPRWLGSRNDWLPIAIASAPAAQPGPAAR